MNPEVTGVEVVPPYGLRLAFADGTTGFVDGSRWVLGKTSGVFAALRDPAEFAKVFVDAEAGTIAWPNEIDIDPDTLYELAHASTTHR